MRRSLYFLLALAVVVPGMGHAAGPAIQPHKAAYDMVLSSVEPNSQVVHARGHFDFEWSDACDAWTISQDAVMEVGHSDGTVFQFAWSYNAWESKDGRTLRYAIVRRFDHGGKEEIRGEATLDPQGAGVARFTMPEGQEIALPAGTLFPTGQTLDMLTALQQNEVPPWRVLFDGSGDDGLFGVSSVLAREFAAGASGESTAASSLTQGRRSWSMHLAFFDLEGQASLPEQEQSLRLYDNGVADDIIFDYGDFSVRAELKEIEALEKSGC